MIVTIDGIPVYRAALNGDDTGMYCISLVDEPAVLRDFQKLSKQERADREATRQLYAITDEDKHLVRGVVMRSDFPIYRRDWNGYEYYIIYRADTIREMAEKYLADKLQNQVNLDHQEAEYVEGVQMVQWYLKNTEAGIAPEGFEDCADGSLFAEFHITNEEIWAAVKEGTYKGFSLEGYFELLPETNKDDVDRIVEETKGLFSKLSKIYNMKVSKFINALRKAVSFRTVTSDKGIIAWEGDEDLKVGDELFIEDEEGNRTPAEDGTYTLTDGTAVVVAEGKVESITEPAGAAEENFGEVSTDKGTIRWDGEEDLKEGDSVYRIDEEGNRADLEDGIYTTEDGKQITIENGVVATIVDPAAEIEARRQARRAIAQSFEASYDEKYRAIEEAIREKRGNREDEYFYIEEAGDDFAVVCVWNEIDWTDHYFRYSITVSEDATVTINGDEQEVKQMWVPLDFVSPFETNEEAVAAKAELATLRAEVEDLRKKAAALPAHKEVSSKFANQATTRRENLARVLNARRK